MKRLSSSLRLVLPATALLLHGLAAQAVTFTNDTAISFNNTNYDGLDIVVTNCTLTVDGVHAFASLQVLNAGNLTHTYAPGGYLENRQSITNEQQVLSTTNVATLSNTNVVVSSIVVQDLTGLVTYTSGVDYVTGLDTQGPTTLLLTTNSAIADGSTEPGQLRFPGAARGGWVEPDGDRRCHRSARRDDQRRRQGLRRWCGAWRGHIVRRPTERQRRRSWRVWGPERSSRWKRGAL